MKRTSDDAVKESEVPSLQGMRDVRRDDVGRLGAGKFTSSSNLQSRDALCHDSYSALIASFLPAFLCVSVTASY